MTRLFNAGYGDTVLNWACSIHVCLHMSISFLNLSILVPTKNITIENNDMDQR